MANPQSGYQVPNPFTTMAAPGKKNPGELAVEREEQHRQQMQQLLRQQEYFEAQRLLLREVQQLLLLRPSPMSRMAFLLLGCSTLGTCGRGPAHSKIFLIHPFFNLIS